MAKTTSTTAQFRATPTDLSNIEFVASVMRSAGTPFITRSDVIRVCLASMADLLRAELGALQQAATAEPAQ